MRAHLVSLMFLAGSLGVSFGQADWTPNTPKPSPEQNWHKAWDSHNQLAGVSVGMVTLSSKDARKHYKIKIPNEEQLVMVERIDRPPVYSMPGVYEAGCHERRGQYGSIMVGDLIDTVVLGGEIPQHGQVKTVADFDRFVLSCESGCLVFVRHKDCGATSDIIQQGELHPKFFSRDGDHACDSKTRYVYNVGFNPRGTEQENWSGPGTCPSNRENYPFAIPSDSTSAQLSGTGSVEQDIAAIRNAPHEAMPLAQTSRAPLGGQTSMTMENGTNYTVYFYLGGPNSQELTIAPGGTQTLRVSPGNYEIAAKVSDPSVIPFYGTETCVANTQYSHHFYISTQPR